MTIGTGMAAQLGVKQEAAYNTYAVPDHFYEFLTAPIQPKVYRQDTPRLGKHFLGTGDNRAAQRGGTGTITGHLMTKAWGLVLKAMLGNVATAGAAAPFTHTFTPNLAALAANSYTVQVGVPDVGGTVRPFNWRGGKITEWELSNDTDSNLAISTTWDFGAHDVTNALATPALPTGNSPLSWLDGSITLGGVSQCIRRIRIHGAPSLAIDRYCIGNTVKAPLPNGIYAVDGEFEWEFPNLDVYTAFLNGTLATLVAEWASGGRGLRVTLQNVQYLGNAPEVSGPDIVMQTVPFRALWDGTNALISAVYTSDDATP